MSSTAAKRLLLGGWFQQLAASGSLLVFNMFAASFVGLTAFGDFAAAAGLTTLCAGVLLGGFDVFALRIGHAGAVDRVALRTLIRKKLPALIFLGAVIAGLGPVLFPRANHPASLALAAALYVVSQGMSSLLINAIIGAGLSSSAISLSAIHGALLLAVPYMIGGAPSGEMLTAALSSTYVVAIALELVVLHRVQHVASPDPVPSVRALLSGAAPTWFDAARGGGALYLGSLILPPAHLAVARLLLGLQQGVASLLPISQSAITALAREFDDDEEYREMVTATTTSASVIAAAGGACGTAVLGVLAYRAESEFLSTAAPAAAIGAAMSVLLRLYVGRAAGLQSGEELARVLAGPALFTAILPAIAAAISGLPGFVIMMALAPGLALYRLGYRVGRVPRWTIVALAVVVSIALNVPEIGKALGSPILAAFFAVAASFVFAVGLWWSGGLPLLRGGSSLGYRK